MTINELNYLNHGYYTHLHHIQTWRSEKKIRESDEQID